MSNPHLLGRLVRVDVRQVWSSEAQSFTPWLAQEQNLRLLGEAVGMELELEAQEKDVGPFRADLLCRDTATNDWVLIENQLERTDHTHLGQIITYAAGLKAVTIIWIANPFTEEHRAALDWLNDITESRFSFFGIEVELWRIGDSPVAPKFNVISKPNDWSKTVERESSKAVTDTKALQLRFWTGFHDFVRQQTTTIRPTKPLPQHWMNMAAGRSGVAFSAIASLYDNETGSYKTNEARVELQLTDRNAKGYFSALKVEQDAIERELGYSLTWHNPPESRTSRIYTRRPADLKNEASWPELYQWMQGRLEEFHRVFGPRIKRMIPISSTNEGHVS